MSAPINIEKKLEGKIKLIGSSLGNTIYTFTLPEQSGTQVTDKLSTMNLEEVFIICDTTDGDITINLPYITSFKGFWNVKVFISFNGGFNSLFVKPYINEVEELYDNINGVGTVNLSPTQTNYYHIVDNNTWAQFVCPPYIPA